MNYVNGTLMNKFKHLEEISHYNHNYYVGNDKDLLFGKSDDDNTTDWWLIKNEQFIYLGQSYTSGNDVLHRFESVQT